MNLNGWGSYCNDCIPEELAMRTWGTDDDTDEPWTPWQ